MTAAVIAFSLIIASLVGLVVYLVRRGDRAVDLTADARVAQVATEAELERAQFELEHAQKALARAVATINALEGMPHAVSNADLAPHDVDGRLRRFAVEWATEAAGGPVRVGADHALPSTPAAVEAGPLAVPTDGDVS